jgi:exoribonuclease R
MPFLRTKNYKEFQVIDETTDTVVLVFEGATKANKALPGDEVELDASGSVVLKSRAPHQVIAGYLELNSKTTYGLTKRGFPIYLFTPLNPAYPSFIVGSNETDKSSKVVALVEFLEWKDRVLPRGSLKRILGPAGDLAAEEEGILWNACPWTSLTKDLKLLEDDCPNRKILTGTTFNIDPEGCKDIDDCITLEKDGQDWLLTITIADVASCIEEMGAVDCMASAQGQTLYRNGQAVRPMLPPYYSEEHCSLLPGVPRRGVSLTLRLGSEGGLKESPVWSETTIVNGASYSYEECNADSGIGKVLADLVSRLDGSQKALLSVRDPHEWIEILMVFYNTEAAKLLLTGGVGILRAHEAPDLETLERYTKMDPALGVLASSAAKYCLIGSDGPTRHWGLDAAAYCHASSPIRRYADLANQRILKQLIRGNKQGLVVSVPISDLNDRSKISKGYERDRVFLQALLGKGQRQFDALVLDLVEEADGRLKVVLWIREWQQKIRCRYTLVKKEVTGCRVLLADESKEVDLMEGTSVRIQCGLNLDQSRWKDRIVVSLC